MLDGGYGTGFVIAGNLYDVAFYSLSGTGNTNASLIAGPYKFYGKGTEKDWMQFGPVAVDLAPNTTYAYVWDLDAANANLTVGQSADISEQFWITGGSPALTGAGVGGGEIATIQAPNAIAATSGQAMPAAGSVNYNNPRSTLRRSI